MHQTFFRVALFSMLSASPLAAQAQPFLYEAATLLSDENPRSSAAGDLDLNGWIDLAVAEPSTGGIQIYLQVFPGTFASPIGIGLGTGFEVVELIDLNLDGALDVVAIDVDSPSSVQVALGDGAGGFSSLTPTSLPGVGEALEAADLNGDGDLDLVVALSDVGQLAVLLGNGDGSLNTPSSYAAASFVTSLDLGDLNGDGILDAIGITSAMGVIAVLAGDGVGGFLAPQLLPAFKTEQAQLVDLDGDGDLDIAGVSSLLSALITFENMGSSFGAAQTTSIPESGNSFALADMDGDGALDAIVGSGGTQQLSIGSLVRIYPADGSGGFTSPGQDAGHAIATDSADDLALADMDNDGLTDVIVTVPKRMATIVFHGDGNGGLRSELGYDAGLEPRGIRSTDFDSDGIPDIATANVGSNSLNNGIRIFLGLGDGTFGQAVGFTNAADDLELVDLNLDGITDILYREFNGIQICTIVGNGDGTFGFTSCINGGHAYDNLDVGLINGDAFPDALNVSSRSAELLISLGNGSGALFGGGTQVFLGGSPFDIEVCDWDGDGDDDAVITDQSMPGLILLANNGTGDLSTRTDLLLPAAAGNVILSADLNRDGFVDLVTDGIGEVLVLYGLGGGFFDTPMTIPLQQTFPLTLGDVNRDGWPDLVGNGNLLVGVALSDGSGGFLPPSIYASRDRVQDVTIQDIDGNGWDDVITVENRVGDVSIYLNLAPSQARTQIRNGNGSNPLVFASTSTPIVAQAWNCSIDASAFPLAALGVVVVTDRGLQGLSSPFGELLVGLPPFGFQLASDLQPIIAGSSAHAFAIPSDPALIGTFVATQAALVGSGVTLTNAIDLVLGDS